MVETKSSYEKDEKSEKNDKVIIQSYYIVQYLMVCSLIIIILLSFFITDPNIQPIMYLEIFITAVSSTLYTIFINKIQKYEDTKKSINWNDISKTRYWGWTFTTPAMLIVLCLVLGINSKIAVDFWTVFSVILLDMIMLLTGYLGESNILDRITAMGLGFIPFLAMFSIIYMKFIQPKSIWFNNLLFIAYLLFWTIYGIVFIFDEKYKNIVTNILDFIAKGLIGLGISFYYL